MTALCPVSAALERCLQRHELGERTLVAGVSGGMDSTALAAALAGRGGRFVLLHVDHGQHADSARAAAAVRSLAMRLCAPCEIVRLEVGTGASEGTLRAARLAAFAATARAHGAGAVLTAHHTGDQVETVVFRLQRGTGARGLAGIPPARALLADVLLLRPFLAVPKAMLAAVVAAAGLSEHVVEDPTNADLRFARNAVRAKVLPALRARHGAGIDRAILARAAARRARADALERAARSWLAECAHLAPGLRVELFALLPADRRLAREILRLAFLALGGGAPGGHWLARALATLAAGRGTLLDAGGGVLGERTREGLLLISTRSGAGVDGPTPLRASGELVAFGATGLCLRMVPRTPAVLRSEDLDARAGGRRRAVFDADAAPGPWTLRAPRAGDRFDAPGMPRPVRLLPHLVARGVPRLDRTTVPIVVDARGRIVWAPHLDVAAYARISAATARALRVELASPSGSLADAPSY